MDIQILNLYLRDINLTVVRNQALIFFGMGNRDFSGASNIRIDEIPENIKNILKKRSNARISKNWELSDKYRQELFDLGWAIVDGKDGQEIVKK